MTKNLAAALSINDLLASAVAELNNGRLSAAENISESVLASDPDNVRALLVRSSALARQGNRRAARRDLERASRLQPGDPAVAIGFCRLLLLEGSRQQAQKIINEGLPKLAGRDELLRDAAELLMNLGRARDAIPLLDRVVMLHVEDPVAFNMRGFALQQIGDHKGAIGNFSRALQLQPALHYAMNNRGNSLLALGRTDEALKDFDLAVRLRPDQPHAWTNRARALLQSGRAEEALGSVEKALELEPRSPIVLTAKAEIVRALDRREEEVSLREKITGLLPSSADAWNNLGLSLQEAARFNEAEASYMKAVELRQPFPQAQWNLALLRLAAGDYAEGWKAFEWRWQCPEFGGKPHIPGVAEWTGESLAGKSIAVIAEQGLGDIIQFSRFLVPIMDMAERTVLVVPAGLHRLLSTLDPRLELVDPSRPVPNIHLFCTLMSIPARLGVSSLGLDGKFPYLEAEPDRIEAWRKQVGTHGLKVGLIWQGNPTHADDRKRSIALRQLAPLSAVPGIRLISLQYGAGAEQLADLPEGMTVEVLDGFNAGPDAFADTAGVMRCLDVVVSVDTAAVHLAGALGVRGFVLLRRPSDWRWLRDRSDSPWYPSLRLFRQKDGSGWGGAIDELAQALAALARERGL